LLQYKGKEKGFNPIVVTHPEISNPLFNSISDYEVEKKLKSEKE